jgi:hypothetical protein
MATTLASGESIAVLCELGFEVNFFTLDDATLGQLDTGGFLDGTLLGDDVSPYIQQLSITRGRTDPLSNFNAGTCTIVLNNNDRRFDPINQASPYYDVTAGRSGVTPRRKVTITSGGLPLFVGRITDIDIDYDFTNSTVTFAVADDFVLLANANVASALTPAVELSGTRVSYLLDLPEIAYSATTRSIAAGTSALGAYQIDANTNALSYLQKIAESEQGLCFIAANGNLTFTDRLSAAFATIAATFSDTGTDIPYQTLAVLYGQEQLYNRVQTTVVGGTVQTASDATSQTEFGVSTFAIDNLLLASDAEALTLATSLVNTYSEPIYRFDDLTVSVSSLSAPNRAIVVGLEIGDVVAITRTYNTGTPASTTQNYAVERVQHTLTAAQHSATFGLRAASILYQFLLDDATFGVLDSTNALA